MKKILLGLIAVLVIAAGGYFGFGFYVQHRVTREVEAAFEQIRSTGAKASHGKVAFDLKSRTLTIADISTDMAAQNPFSVRIANLTASGVGQSDATKFSADALEFTDVEVSVTAPAPTVAFVTYKLPRVTLKNYAGSVSPAALPASTSFIELYRYVYGQLAAFDAESVTVPSMTGTVKLAGATSGTADFTYSAIALENLKGGKIASAKIDKVALSLDAQTKGQPINFSGDVANLVASDVDVGTMARLFAPGNEADDKNYRVYGHVSAGPYVVSSPMGLKLKVDGMSIDDVAMKPSRMQLATLMALLPQAGGTPPSPTQARALLDRVATVYEGVRIGNGEMHGLLIETPDGPMTIASLRGNFDGGKIGEFAVEGVEAGTPKAPVKIGRFALKSLDVTNLMRLSAQFAGKKPTAEQALALLPLIEGVELANVVTPYKSTDKPVNIDVFSLDWGQFVGSIPSKLRLVLKMAGPVNANDDTNLQFLTAAGFDRISVGADLGAAWTEASHSFELDPIKLNLEGLLETSTKISLANVPRDTFSSNLATATSAGAQIEVGAIELTVHDLGALDLVVAQYARSHGVSRDDARNAILDGIKAQGEAIGGGNPDAAALIAAISHFVETPRQTLVIKLTPLAKAPVLQLIQLLKTDPQSALAQFKIAASTGL